MNRRLALAGLLSPVFLALATIAVAAQRPDYSHVANTLSELGSAGRPNALWMNYAGIIPSGVLTMIAALPLSRTFASRAGGIVLALGGAFLAATALSPWTGPPNDISSLQSKLHLVFALLGFFCLALAPLLFGLRVRRMAGLTIWFWISIAAAALIFLFAFVLPRPPYLGLFQRLALAVFFAWLVAGSIRALRT
jgi:hypothetical membrane protein